MSEHKKIKHIREVQVKEIILYFFLPLIILVTIWLTYGLNCKYQFIKIDNFVSLIVLIILTYPFLKMFIIGIILLYKAFAPMSVRDRCLFEPTCSTYMIIAIKKYGLIIGLFKGIKRIIRCRPPNGGVDWP